MEYTKTDIEDMIRRLQMVGSGANSHTRNKTIYYLKRYTKRLMPLAEEAIATNNFDKLRFALDHLW